MGRAPFVGSELLKVYVALKCSAKRGQTKHDVYFTKALVRKKARKNMRIYG